MTPVSKRAAPPQLFEGYTFAYTKSQHASLSEVEVLKLKPVPGAAGDGYANNVETDVLDIGFNFSFNGTTYNKFVASTSGFLVLVDPAVGTFSLSDVLSGLDYQNDTILTTFAQNHVLLAPWFGNLRNVATDVTQLSPSPTEQYVSEHGISPGLSSLYDTINSGIRYAVDNSNDGQKRLIVRWNSYSYEGSPYARLTFEVVLYENGKVEFRYAPLVVLGGTGFENATMGVFLGAQNFRDLTNVADYVNGTGTRGLSPFGGYVYSSAYNDIGSPYVIRLKTQHNWPARGDTYAILTFAPPARRRKILPRVQASFIDSQTSYPRQERLGTGLSTRTQQYDDRLSVSFMTGTVDMPTGLSRGYANGLLGAAEAVNLSYSGSIVAPLRIRSSVVDGFIKPNVVSRHAPFTESDRHEQDTESTFYLGSSIDDVGLGFNTHLRSKTQLKLSLPVSKKTALFDTLSSIHYYNPTQKGWYFPQNAGGQNDVFDPIDQIGLNNGDLFTGGERGFNAVGNLVSSGTFSEQDRRYSATSRNYFESVRLNESLQNNPRYAPTNDEYAALKVDQPFLLEKAVIEVPLILDVDWFSDKTASGLTYGGPEVFNDNYDFGGPALTFAVWNHHAGQSETYMDLIMSGTIIPVGDNIRNVKFEKTRTDYGFDFYNLSPEGFLAHNGTPTCVVSPNVDDGTFTGSVRLEMQAAVSNGYVSQFFAQVTTSNVSRNNVINLLTSETIDVDSLAYSYVEPLYENHIRTTNPFGRGVGGIDPSGRSYFGKEFTTLEFTGEAVKNPLFYSASYDDLPYEIKTKLIAETPHVRASFMLPVEKSTVSPYLLLPGDRLVFSISKVRPKVFGDGTDPLTVGSIDYFTGSARHHVSLNTGSVNMTLYGSMVKMGAEFHDPLSQEIGTNQIHEVIGNYPVTDQFEVEYRGLYEGTCQDDYMVGELIKTKIVDGKTVFSGSAVRRKAFSKTHAADYPVLKSFPNRHPDVIINPSKSYRLQPWSERAGNIRNVAFLSNERIYDSMVPSMVDCWKLDGAQPIAVPPYGYTEGGSPNQWNFPLLLETGNALGISSMMAFNYQNATNEGINSVWTWAYPFEPRYSTVVRQSDIDAATRITCTKYIHSNRFGGAVEEIEPKVSSFFYPMFAGYKPGFNLFGTPTLGLNLVTDVRFDKSIVLYEDFEQVTIPNLPDEWTVGGSVGWKTQNSVVFEGSNAAKAGTISHLETTSIITSLNSVEDFKYTITFHYKVDCELGFDFLNFYIDNGDGSGYVLIDSFTGVDQPWTEYTSPEQTAGAGGLCRFMWEYAKDATISTGTDTAYIDLVRIDPQLYVTSSMNASDLSKVIFGFGDTNTMTNLSDGGAARDRITGGYTHEPAFRQEEITNVSTMYSCGPIIRGWKYGLSSGLPEYSKTIYRTGRYGQFRDRLEQPYHTKFYIDGKPTDSPVTVTFVNYLNKLRYHNPLNTWSSNVSLEATSSLPYFDGHSRNRPEIVSTTLGTSTEIFATSTKALDIAVTK